MDEAADAERVILELTGARGADKSICPTEAARRLAAGSGKGAGDAWRARLAEVRQAAVRLARAGRIEILHKGRPVEPDALRGVIRLRHRPG